MSDRRPILYMLPYVGPEAAQARHLVGKVVAGGVIMQKIAYL